MSKPEHIGEIMPRVMAEITNKSKRKGDKKMAYQISIEIVLSERDDALLNEAYEYLNFTDQGLDPDTDKDVNNFLQFIFKMIAIRHGIEPKALNRFHGKLHDDFLELKSGRVSLQQATSEDLILNRKMNN
jgi:hypothetical protein